MRRFGRNSRVMWRGQHKSNQKTAVPDLERRIIMRRIPVSTLTAAAGRLLVALLFGGALLAGTNSFGQSSPTHSRCVQAGGTLMTNFTSQTKKLGTATGDLKGAVAAT